uniref:Uncharacterized protein n=1 Tax=Acrobeloides nanus TaxID=290746 RepID=A0A914C0U4_9BILA
MIFKATLGSAQQLSSITPCAYPNVHDRAHCGILDPQLDHGLICDPDNVISMSEAHLVDTFLQRVYNERKHKCICNKSKGLNCWYKFGFAFLREIFPVDGAVSDLYGRDHCPMNRSLVQLAQYQPEHLTKADSIYEYAHNFARIVRERWDFSSCGEDILILVVLQRPAQLVPDSLPDSSQHQGASSNRLPVIFVSYGSQVAERFGLAEGFHAMPYSLEPLQRIVDEENERLQNGYPLQRVLNDMIQRLVVVLERAEKYRSPSPPKDHIPFWAWMAFATCVRRWKAGFVGDDTTPANPQGATTYVNLVQMMMPPHRSNYATPASGQF